MLACSRLRDSRVRWIEKAQTGESFASSPLSESLEQDNFSRAFSFRVFRTILEPGTGYLYSTANDPQPQMIPRPQTIPKMDRKWSSTASDP